MKVNVTLYVPRIQYDKIKVKLFNGPIRGEKLKTKELAAKQQMASSLLPLYKQKKSELKQQMDKLNWLITSVV